MMFYFHNIAEKDIYNSYENKIRNVEVTYIYGAPGVGKTSYVYKKYGFENVYRVTNYNRNMFDNYKGQQVLVFDEFNSQLKIEEILNYLDIYPLWLPCRYNNKVACFDKIFLISNLPLSQQYLNIQSFSPDQYKALLRRIHKILKL